MKNRMKLAVGTNLHSVSVESDGTEEGTNFEGTGRDADIANLAANLMLNVQLGSANGPVLSAGFETPQQLVAAMLFAVGHKSAFVIEAPVEILEFLEPFTDEETGLVILYEGEE